MQLALRRENELVTVRVEVVYVWDDFAGRRNRLLTHSDF